MSLTTEHSLWFIPLCIALGALYAWILYRGSRDRYEWSNPLMWLLAVARTITVSLLAFFLLGPMLRVMLREEQRPVVVIAHDGSASVTAGKDSTEIRNGYAERLKALEKQLSEKYDVRSFTYGDAVREGIDFTQKDRITDPSSMLREVYDRYSGVNLGAVIMDGDGLYNRGRDPRYEAERLGVPLYTIALGDTTVRRDMILKEISYDHVTYLGNQFPLLVRYEARHLGRENTALVVTHNGKEVVRRPVSIAQDPEFGEVPLLVEATDAGLQRYRVELRPINGEVSTSNNATDIFIDVLDDRQKVLLLALAPHPDVAAISEAVSGNKNYELHHKLINDFTGDLKGVDLLILHQLPGRGGKGKDLIKLADAAKVPVWAILGSNSDLKEVEDSGLGLSVSGAGNSMSDVHASFNQNFTPFQMPAEDGRVFERFPPLQVPFGEYKSTASLISLFKQRVGMIETAYPLLAFSSQSGSRKAVLVGEGIWRWRLYDHLQNGSHKRIDGLISKTVQFLALKAQRDRFRVNSAQLFEENERVQFDAEFYDDALEPLNEPDVEMRIKNEADEQFVHAFSRTGSGYRLDIGAMPAGRYTYTATTKWQGKSYRKSGEFSVTALLAESVNTVADHLFMEELASKNNGIMVTSDQLDRIAEALGQRKEVVTRSISRAALSDVISLRWIFFVLLALLTLEWALRRRNGAY